MATEADNEMRKNGLRILARMIVSAHLREADAREKLIEQTGSESMNFDEKAKATHSRVASTTRAKKAKAGANA